MKKDPAMRRQPAGATKNVEDVRHGWGGVWKNSVITSYIKAPIYIWTYMFMIIENFHTETFTHLEKQIIQKS